jgi:2-(1,2-epoxy-1,2-dihydrophenyl)acetyl-CoA isomerase
MSDDILLEVDDGVAVVTINRPQRLNSVTRTAAHQLAQTLWGLRDRDDVKAVVLTGAGKAFCAGLDLSSEDASSPELRVEGRPRYVVRSPLWGFGDVTRAIVGVDKPVIAAIAGPAVGAGLAFALAADRRIAESTARLSAIFVRRGLAPDCGLSYFLPRIVGLPKALWMVTTGVLLGAQEALAMGLVDEVVEEGRALEAALRYARQFARGASVAVELARRAIYKSLSSNLEEMLLYEEFAGMTAAQTEDAREGLAAFLEKREPNFRGR